MKLFAWCDEGEKPTGIINYNWLDLPEKTINLSGKEYVMKATRYIRFRICLKIIKVWELYMILWGSPKYKFKMEFRHWS